MNARATRVGFSAAASMGNVAGELQGLDPMRLKPSMAFKNRKREPKDAPSIYHGKRSARSVADGAVLGKPQWPSMTTGVIIVKS